ncbi:FAD-dependent oxidoreductase [Aureibacter tunicatorum]|uniref:Glycine/D-amino acid oxidase-like deaminating enzyme n=1 Tax=Aureibacter tunicatorum TaxID=866807 RepID=A0AAE3XS39_9BACT|nr:FAD-dependent oxidoreductase [Aureibacter tunicatorum]MDR6240454.1 glycine/D-amino acid oxidase-like deaminating enzyme [Aureibacter tunicatorum]BDD05667.1 hypothetical protein AUTU_31500 [Aureibacter tunicatorum]
MNKSKKECVLIGAGIVNLITAYYLNKSGVKVMVKDRSSDPLTNVSERQGATFGGENARMFTFTEADNYNEKSHDIYRNMSDIIQNTIYNDGWRVVNEMRNTETEWLYYFQGVSPSDAVKFSDDIYDINIKSGMMWSEMMYEEPDLFESSNVRKDIVRIYSDRKDFVAAKKLHQKIGSFIKELDFDSLIDDYGYLKTAINQNHLGGAMICNGFTLQIHDFCVNLIKLLEERGVEFQWLQEFQGFEKSDCGKITGLKINEKVTRPKYSVLSLGAYSGDLYNQMDSENKVHGILGIWLSVPNVYGVKNSLKIHKDGHVGEDTNVTVVEESNAKRLVFGSGYGYVGSVKYDECTIDDLKPLYDSLLETVKIYFPEAYELAHLDGSLYEGWKYCIRPFTPTGLGIYEVQDTEDGGIVILTGGHNTGGFTQAPLIAKSVLDTLNNESTSMERTFHPIRGISSIVESV